MLREGGAFRPWSIGRWLDGHHHTDPLGWFFHRWGLAEPFRSGAHGLQSHPSRSPRMNRFEYQRVWNTKLACKLPPVFVQVAEDKIRSAVGVCQLAELGETQLVPVRAKFPVGLLDFGDRPQLQGETIHGS